MKRGHKSPVPAWAMSDELLGYGCARALNDGALVVGQVSAAHSCPLSGHALTVELPPDAVYPLCARFRRLLGCQRQFYTASDLIKACPLPVARLF
jgi:hypothetical protein